MIISRTPYRISFFGGGTDYPSWYRKHGGAVLSATINKYCYLTCRYLPPFFAHKYRVVYSKMEHCHSLNDLQHPAVREVIRYVGLDRGLCITHDGDLPARSGMGSSSAFTVGLLNGLYSLQGKMVSKHQLARESIHIEQDILKETVGSQDQVAAAYGGMSRIHFMPNDEISVIPITASTERINELQSHLMLFYTGIKRTAANVAQTYVSSMDENRRQMRLMEQLMKEGIEVLCNGRNMMEFGELLHEGWLAKRSLSQKVSNPAIDQMYETALSAGATGGKITGAGGGGFMLLFAPPEKHHTIKSALSDVIHVPFQFEYSGSQIIVCDREEDYQEAERVRGNQNIRACVDLETESDSGVITPLPAIASRTSA